MSAYTTLYVSRGAALKKLRQLREEKEPSNNQIEDEIDNLLSDTLYNFLIVPDYDNHDNGDACLARLKSEGF